jgi:hypothetical protein
MAVIKGSSSVTSCDFKLGRGPHSTLRHDTNIRSLFEAIRQLMAPPPVPPKPEIGFHVKEDAVPYRPAWSRAASVLAVSEG